MVSIVLCTYNRKEMVRESIDSILAQTYQDFELLIIDDGSTDGTRDILKQYQDERIRLFLFDENRYYCRAANFGIQQMQGDFLAIANSDDIWYPTKLERQMEYLEKHPECGACFTYADVIDENGKMADQDFPDIARMLKRRFQTQEEWMRYFFREGNCLAHPSAVIPRWMIEKMRGFHLLFCQGADLDLWIRILREAPIYVVPEILTRYRCHHNPDNQISGAEELKAARFMNEHMLMRKKMMKMLTDVELRRFFQCDFRRKDAESHLEMEIERAFLLMECTSGLPELRVLGIEKFEEILDTYQEEAVQVLKEKYNTSLQDIYQWNLGHFYVDFGIHVQMADRVRRQQELEQEVQQNAEEMQCLAQKVEQQKKELQQMEVQKQSLAEIIQNLEAEKAELVKQTETQQKKISQGIMDLKRAQNILEEQRQENKRTLHLLEQQVMENIKLCETKGRKKWL